MLAPIKIEEQWKGILPSFFLKNTFIHLDCQGALGSWSLCRKDRKASSNSRDWHTPNAAINTSWQWPWRQQKQSPCRNKLYFERYFSHVGVFLELYWLIFFSSNANIYKIIPILIFFSPCCLIRQLTGGHSCSRFSVSWGSVICIWWHFLKRRVIDLQPNIFLCPS